MKKLIVVVLFTIAVNAQAQTQTDYVEVLANNDSNVFKMVWMPKVWPDSLVGFEVKYSSNQNDWEKLTEDIFIPEINQEKSSPFIFGSAESANQNNQIIAQLFDNGQLKPTSNQDFKNNIFNSSSEIKALGFLFAFELPAYMYAGFGLMDYEKHYSENYYYGLFPVFTDSKSDEAVYTYYYEHNKALTYNIDFKSKLSLKGKNTLVVTWDFDGKEFKNKGLKGVNLYKQEDGKLIQLNDEFIVITNKTGDASISREYKIKELNEEVRFLIEPVSYLNFQGEKRAIDFNKKELVFDVEAPTIDMINSGINNEGTGMELHWEFSDRGKNSFEYLAIERKEKNGDFKVIDSVTATTEIYTDSPEEDSLYYYYRITATPKIGNKLLSNTYLGFFKSNPKPDIPNGLEGSYSSDNDRIIDLSWLPNKDEATAGYQIYSGSNPNELARESSIDILSKSSYQFKVYRTRAKSYYFAVSAINDQSKESELSNTIEVIVPSESIPPLNVWPIAKENNQVILNWQYPENIADLDIFNIYRDGELVDSVSNDTRNWRSGDLEGGTYSYQVEAITRTGVTSGLSKVRIFKID